MNNLEKLTDALGSVGGQYIEEAASYAKPAVRKSVWLRLGAAAACAALIVGGIFAVRALRSAPADVPEPSAANPGLSVDGPGTEIDVILPWEELPVELQYPLVSREGRSYHTQQNAPLPAERVGEALGNVVAEGYSEPDGVRHEKAAALFEITGISPECAVAVRYEGEETFFPAVNSYYRPATFGQLVNDLSLRDELRFGSVWRGEWRSSGDYVQVCYDGLDGERVWELLLSAEDAENVWRDGEPLPDELLSVSIDLPLLGIYGVGLTVYEGGAISTNLLDTGKLFYVGEENTLAFVDYVLRECERTELVHQHVSSPELEETFPELETPPDNPQS